MVLSKKHTIGIHAMISSVNSTGKGGIGILSHGFAFTVRRMLTILRDHAHLLSQAVRLDGEAEGLLRMGVDGGDDCRG